MRYALKALALIGMVSLTVACTPVTHTRGNLSKVDPATEIIPGETSKSDILTIFGSPTTKSAFNNSSWYYIGERTEQKAFFRPDIVERRVVLVNFNEQDTVEELKILTEADGREVYIIDRETPTSGREMNAIQQILGNVGRFRPGQ